MPAVVIVVGADAQCFGTVIPVLHIHDLTFHIFAFTFLAGLGFHVNMKTAADVRGKVRLSPLLKSLVVKLHVSVL
jgi:hypothetical protein